jgi:uncharacterized protein YdhG (YjbR/CyaY superfamily)
VNKQISTIDEYLAVLPEDIKIELQRIRDTILKTIPGIKERIAYKICVFSLKKDIVGFASQKNHCSFYVMSPKLVLKMKNDLKDLKISGATIHFTPNKPIPESIITRILKARLEEYTEGN